MAGCLPAEDCVSNPGHEDCFEISDVGPDNVPLTFSDSGTPLSYLSYQNVEWIDDYFCGGFEQKILWTFPGGAPSDGWIIQKITTSSDAFNLAESVDELSAGQCIAGGSQSLEYWEAWEVNAGADHVSYQNGIDLWRVSSINVDGTTYTQHGEAIFRSGPLPAGFSENTVPQANGLPSTFEEPGFWQNIPETQKLVREITTLVTCCPPGPNNFNNSHQDQ